MYTLWPPALGGCGAAVLVEDSVASVLAVYTILFCMVLVVIGVKTTAALLARGRASMRVGACCALQLSNCALRAVFCALLYKCTRNAREARGRRNDDAFIIER